MYVSVLSADGRTRLTVIVADGLVTAEKLFPGSICVERGSMADLAAIDLEYAPETPVVGDGVVDTKEEAQAAVAADPTLWEKFKGLLGFGS